MSRNDSASITVNFTLPPEVIREYFTGLAKVETAKHSSESGKSFDWSTLLAFAPLFMPLLTNMMKSSDLSSAAESVTKKATESKQSSVRVPEPHNECTAKTSSEETPNATCDTKSEVVISFTRKPTEEATTETKLEVEHSTTDKEAKAECKDDEKKSDSVVENKTESTVTSVKKRPVYQDGDNVVLDLKDLTGALGNGSGGIADMMKMFAPMMEGLMGNMNGMNGMNGMNVTTSKSTETVTKADDSSMKITETAQIKDTLEEESEKAVFFSAEE